MLGWTANEMAAAAKIGIATMKRFESGQGVQEATTTAIATALVNAGIELISPGDASLKGGAGVRLSDPA